jgi:hypothetical protein
MITRASSDAQSILEQLHAVSEQRALRAMDPQLDARVQAVKHFQHARFERTYADLLADPRYGKAARFFLDELYGPRDFTRRDTQFARVIPALVRMFPKEIVLTVKALAELHGLSEVLDSATGRALPEGPLSAQRYGEAWRAVGREADRERQVMLTRQVGMALDAYTRNPLLRHSLRLMRGPARAAGLSELQKFLELGFDTFREMRGAKPFLDIIVAREMAHARELFGAGEEAQPDHDRKPSKGFTLRASSADPADGKPPDETTN